MHPVKPSHRSPFDRNELVILFLVIMAKLVIHMLTSTTYGLHRDAYLYLAQSEHLAWGYISVPPLTAWLVAIQRFLLGDSVFAIRLLPAFAGAVNIFLIGLMVKEMGGKRLALLIATLAYLLSPAFLRANALLQPVSLNQMFWLLSAYIILLIIRRQQGKYWIGLGVVAGIGFLAKYSIVFFLAGFFLAMLATNERKWLTTRYPYIAAGIALLIAFPNLIWQFNHNWPVIRHMHELRESQLVHVEAGGFLIMQFLMNINVVLIWLAGLVFFLFLESGKPFRVLGWIFVFTAGILLVSSGKAYYTLGLYPMLFAGGGLIISKWFETRYKFVPYALIAFIFITLVPVLPFSLAVYSYPDMVKYGKRVSGFGFKEALRWEDGKYYELPQDYADMIGWEETARNVSAVYHSLKPEQQSKCFIYADSYGQAGAINFYRKEYDLPEAISFSGSFIFWIPEYTDLELAIYVNENPRESSDFFRKIELKASVSNPYARNRGYVYLMTEPSVDLPEAWNQLRTDLSGF